MANAWVTHVKQWSQANGVSYGCAISKPECKASYKPKAPKPTKKVAKAKTAVQTELVSKVAQKKEMNSMGGQDINRGLTTAQYGRYKADKAKYDAYIGGVIRYNKSQPDPDMRGPSTYDPKTKKYKQGEKYSRLPKFKFP